MAKQIWVGDCSARNKHSYHVMAKNKLFAEMQSSILLKNQ